MNQLTVAKTGLGERWVHEHGERATVHRELPARRAVPKHFGFALGGRDLSWEQHSEFTTHTSSSIRDTARGA